jgi:hypothetical protein
VSSLTIRQELVEAPTATITLFSTRGNSLTQSYATVTYVHDVIWVTVGETRVMTLSYRPIHIPIFATTMKYVQIDITYTPLVQERNDALVIGMSSEGGLIAAIFAGVGYFLICRRTESIMSSSLNDHPSHDFATNIPALIPGDADKEPSSDSDIEILATGRAGAGGRGARASISVAAGELDLDGFETNTEIWV